VRCRKEGGCGLRGVGGGHGGVLLGSLIAICDFRGRLGSTGVVRVDAAGRRREEAIDIDETLLKVLDAGDSNPGGRGLCDNRRSKDREGHGDRVRRGGNEGSERIACESERDKALEDVDEEHGNVFRVDFGCGRQERQERREREIDWEGGFGEKVGVL
jgi:hypothetical protein